MNQPERQHTEPTPITSQVSAGQILASRRQSWGVTIEDIASNLNLGVDTIEAIEQDAYDRLPGSTFVKGYIRSYAKLMELDAEKVLETLDIVPEQIQEIPSFKSSIKERGKTVPRIKKKSGSGIFKTLFVLILIAGLGVFGLNYLPQLGIEKVSDLFQLPGSKSGVGSDENTITFPSAEEDAKSDGKKSALIRIE